MSCLGYSGTPSFLVCEVVDQVTVLGLKSGRLFTVDAFVGEARQQVSEFVGAPLPEEVRDALLHLSLHLRPAHTPSAAATEQKHAIALPKRVVGGVPSQKCRPALRLLQV